jgi:hypothetical protein
VSLSKKIIDILNNTYSTELKFFKDKYKFKINLVQNAEFLSQEFLFSFYDAKKKLISEFNGTEVKEDVSSKEKFVNIPKEDVNENSEIKEESIEQKKHDGYKGKRKKFFNKSRFKDNKKPKKKEATPSKEIS